MRVANLIVPIRSGAYEVYRKLADALAPRGCSFTWLCSGSGYAAQIAGDGVALPDGSLVASDTMHPVVRTRALVDCVRQLSTDVLVCHALGDPIDLNAVRYMPPSIPRVLSVHSTSLATYRGAQAVRDYVNATIVISPRMRDDLVHSYGFRSETVHLIPNGIDTTAYTPDASRRATGGRLKILSHGRIDDESKGVFWLPEILSRLAGCTSEWEFTLSGDGPDLSSLRQRFARLNLLDRVRIVGWTDSGRVPELMKQHDIFLFPSKYEGFGTTLIEAMACGCVPIASRLPGITDQIIEDGVSGMLFPAGNLRRAADCVLALIGDRQRLASLSLAARNAGCRYSLVSQAEKHLLLLREICEVTPRPLPTDDIAKWKLASGLRPGWWYGLPNPIKAQFRSAREKIRKWMYVS